MLTSATIPTDAALPRIAYSLAVPNQKQVFFHFSEPVYGDASGNPITAADFANASSISVVSSSGNGASEVLVNYPSAISAAQIFAESTAYSLATTVYDNAAPPNNYKTDPAWTNFWAALGGSPPSPL